MVFAQTLVSQHFIKKTMEKLCELFQNISIKVWDTISSNHRRGNYLFEEGITRQLMIASIQDFIEEQKISYIYAQKASNEHQNGGDLEIYLETSIDNYVRIFLQAKIIKENNQYPHLIHQNGNGYQWDLMEKFQEISGCLPYYVFYNGINGFTHAGLDCHGPFNEKQFGCTIADVDSVKRICTASPSNANFTSIHIGSGAIGEPWRKIPCCLLESNKFAAHRTYNLNEINIDKAFYPIFMDSKDNLSNQRFRITEMPEAEKINSILSENGYKPSGRIILSKTEPRRKI